MFTANFDPIDVQPTRRRLRLGSLPGSRKASVAFGAGRQLQEAAAASGPGEPDTPIATISRRAHLQLALNVLIGAGALLILASAYWMRTPIPSCFFIGLGVISAALIASLGIVFERERQTSAAPAAAAAFLPCAARGILADQELSLIMSISSVADDRINCMNHRCLELLGYQREELLGHTAREVGFWKDTDERARLIEVLRCQAPVCDQEIKLRTRSGETCLVQLAFELIELDGETYLLAMGRDTTEQQRREAHDLQARKMESLGRLAGGIAHDFNNLLTVIAGYTDLALDTLAADDPIRSDIAEVRKVADRASGLTRQLLAFVRKQRIAPQIVNLNTLILDLDKFLCRVLGKDIEFIVRPASEDVYVHVDAGQIEQVLVNLAVNARDAIPEGGQLIMELSSCVLDESSPHSRIGLVPGPYIVLGVRDTGIGMPPEVQARIFEPFFTTKTEGGGCGLGLASCDRIIKQYRGAIVVESAVNYGTTFTIFLPQVVDAPVPDPYRSVRSV